MWEDNLRPGKYYVSQKIFPHCDRLPLLISVWFHYYYGDCTMAILLFYFFCIFNILFHPLPKCLIHLWSVWVWVFLFYSMDYNIIYADAQTVSDLPSGSHFNLLSLYCYMSIFFLPIFALLCAPVGGQIWVTSMWNFIFWFLVEFNQFGASTGDGDRRTAKSSYSFPLFLPYRINELPHPKVPASINQVPSSE